jgi:HK97 family phage major capsid protein
MPQPSPGQQRATAAERIAEAKKIQDDADSLNKAITEEEEKKIFELLGEADALQKEADRREQIQIRYDRLDQSQGRITEADKQGVSEPAAGKVPAEVRDRAKEGKMGFASLGDFASSVMKASDPAIGLRDRRLDLAAAASGLNQKVGSEGGFLVPPAFSTLIWDGLNTGAASLLGLTDQYTVEGDSLSFPANSETSRVTGSRYGGIQAYWLDEAAQITPSKPKFRQLKLEPHELYVLVFITDKLLKNSPVALDQYITRSAIEEINFMVGNAIINGDGAGKPKGIMNSGALVTVNKESSQAADTILEQNLVKMWARLHVRCRANATWLINQDVEPQLDLLNRQITNIAGSEVVGGAFSSVYDRQANTIKGRPVVPIEFCSTIGDLGDIILTDLRSYATGVRGGIDSAMSVHLRFDYAESAFRFIFSVDGQTWLAAPLTPFKGANSLSSCETLQAR